MSDSRAYYPGPTVTKKKLVDDVDIPKTGYVQNSKPLQYPPDLENRQLQADNARLREALKRIAFGKFQWRNKMVEIAIAALARPESEASDE